MADERTSKSALQEKIVVFLEGQHTGYTASEIAVKIKQNHVRVRALCTELVVIKVLRVTIKRYPRGEGRGVGKVRAFWLNENKPSQRAGTK